MGAQRVKCNRNRFMSLLDLSAICRTFNGIWLFTHARIAKAYARVGYWSVLTHYWIHIGGGHLRMNSQQPRIGAKLFEFLIA